MKNQVSRSWKTSSLIRSMLGTEISKNQFMIERSIQIESKIITDQTKGEILLMMSLFQKKSGKTKGDDIEIACGSTIINFDVIGSESILPLSIDLFYHGNINITKSIPKASNNNKLMTNSTKFGDITFKVSKKIYDLKTKTESLKSNIEKPKEIPKEIINDYLVEFVIELKSIKIYDKSNSKFFIELNSVFLLETVNIFLENGNSTSNDQTIFDNVIKNFFVKRSKLIECHTKSLIVKIIKEESPGKQNLHSFGKVSLMNLSIVGENKFDADTHFEICLGETNCILKNLDQETLGSINIKFELNSIHQNKKAVTLDNKIDNSIKNNSDLKNLLNSKIKINSSSIVSEMPCKELPRAIEQSQCYVAKNFNKIININKNNHFDIKINSPVKDNSRVSHFPKIPILGNFEDIENIPIISEQSEFNKSIQSHFESYNDQRSNIPLEDIQEIDISQDFEAFETFNPKNVNDLTNSKPQQLIDLLNSQLSDKKDTSYVLEETINILKPSVFSNEQIEIICNLRNFVKYKKQVFESEFQELLDVIEKMTKSELLDLREVILENNWTISYNLFIDIIKRFGNLKLTNNLESLVLLCKSSKVDELNMSNILSLIDCSLNSNERTLKEFVFKEIEQSSIFQFNWLLFLKTSIKKCLNLGFTIDGLFNIFINDSWIDIQNNILAFDFLYIEIFIIYYAKEYNIITKILLDVKNKIMKSNKNSIIDQELKINSLSKLSIDSKSKSHNDNYQPKSFSPLKFLNQNNSKVQFSQINQNIKNELDTDKNNHLENIKIYTSNVKSDNNLNKTSTINIRINIIGVSFDHFPKELIDKYFSLKVKLNEFPKNFESQYFKLQEESQIINLGLNIDNCNEDFEAKLSLFCHKNNQNSCLVASNVIDFKICNPGEQVIDLIPIPTYFVKNNINYSHNHFGKIKMIIEKNCKPQNNSDILFSRNLQNSGELVIAIEKIIFNKNIKNSLREIQIKNSCDEFVILLEMKNNTNNVIFMHSLSRNYFTSQNEFYNFIENILENKFIKGLYKIPLEILNQELKLNDFTNYKISLFIQQDKNKILIGESKINIETVVQSTNEEGVDYYLNIIGNNKELASLIIHAHFTNAPQLYTNSFISSNIFEKDLLKYISFDISCLTLPNKFKEAINIKIMSTNNNKIYYNCMADNQKVIENNNLFLIYEYPMNNIIIPIEDTFDEFSLKIVISSKESVVNGILSIKTQNKNNNDIIHQQIKFQEIGVVAWVRTILIDKDSKTPFKLIETISLIMNLDILRSPISLMNYLNKGDEIFKIDKSEFQNAIKKKINCTRSELQFFENAIKIQNLSDDELVYQKLYPDIILQIKSNIAYGKQLEFFSEIHLFDEHLTGFISKVNLEKILNLQNDLFIDVKSRVNFIDNCPKINDDKLCYLGGLTSFVYSVNKKINILDENNKKINNKVTNKIEKKTLNVVENVSNNNLNEKENDNLIKYLMDKCIFIESVQVNGLRREEDNRKPNSFIEIQIEGCIPELLKSNISICCSSPIFTINSHIKIIDINKLVANFYNCVNSIKTYIREFSQNHDHTIRDILFSKIKFSLSEFFTLDIIDKESKTFKRTIQKIDLDQKGYSLQASIQLLDYNVNNVNFEYKNSPKTSRQSSPGLKDTLNTLKEIQKIENNNPRKNSDDFDPSILDFLKKSRSPSKSKFFYDKNKIDNQISKETLNNLFDQLSKSIPQTDLKLLNQKSINNSMRESGKQKTTNDNENLKNYKNIKEEAENLKISQHSNPFLKVIGDIPEDLSIGKSNEIEILNIQNQQKTPNLESSFSTSQFNLKESVKLAINDTLNYIQIDTQNQNNTFVNRNNKSNKSTNNIIDKLSKTCFSEAEQRRIKRMIESQMVPEELFDFDSDEDLK